ncbi:MAG: hypothetical protein JRD94_18460 [Deltaproteobacteria bacterium]|nr:hypothetical protein [Deltaproteobacteria bacterium]
MNLCSLQAVAWSLVLTVAAFGCDSSSGNVDPCLTALRINLEVDGAVINEVDYEITGNGIVITMFANSVDGTLTCRGSTPFHVEAGQTTSIDVILHCKEAPRFGSVRVNGELNICPEIEKIIVAPLQTARGYTLEVEAEASDEEDDDIHYLWTATDGFFDDPADQDTVFVCGETVEEQLTIEVSDGDCATAGLRLDSI